MENSKKRVIRRLTPLIKDLISNTFVIQAMNLERTIASTFEPSPELQIKLGGMPQAYREMIGKIYGKYMFRAYELGMEKADHTIHIEDPDKMKEEIARKSPMAYETVQEIITELSKETNEYLQAFPKKQEVLEQFKLDLGHAYVDGFYDAVTKDKMPEVMKVTSEVDPELSGLVKALLLKYPVVKTLSPSLVTSMLLHKAEDT